MQVNIPDKDWTADTGTSDPTKIGQDLYQKILAHLSVEPDQKAMGTIATAYGAPQGDMVRLMNNDYGPILAKSPYLTQAQAIQKMTEVQKKYQDEKDIFAIQSDINAAVTPNEIFENEDTSDSEFDLITDLDNIQNILFKRIDPIDIGGSSDTSSSGGVGSPPGAGTNGGKTGPTTAQNGPPASNTGSTSSPLTSDNNGNGDGSGLTPKPDASANPNICFGDNQLDQALSDFDKKKTTDSNFKETPTKNPESDKNGDGNKTNGDSNGNNKPAPFTYSPPDTTPTVAAPAGDWLSDVPCTDVFCIQVNFVKKPVSSYVDADNCIACHVEKIDEKLKETIGHSLIPGKATGNLIEPGICKQATADLLSSVNMRFYAVAKPILTPTNDDLIYGTSASDEWKKFVNVNKPFPFYEQNIPDPKDPKQDTFVPTVIDDATKAALQYSTADTNQATINAQVQAQVTSVQTNITRDAAVYDASVKTDTDASFYQSIKHELEQMNFYFDSFNSILTSINVNSDTNIAACDDLNNKSACT